SNIGPCVDWFAPGNAIESAWHTGPNDTAVKNGTSMASPHVAGVATLYLEKHPTATPTQVRDALFALTTKGVVTSSNTTNNHLLYAIEQETPEDRVAPTVALTAPDDGSRYNWGTVINMAATASDN